MESPSVTGPDNPYPMTRGHQIGNGCIKFVLASLFILLGGVAGCTATVRVAGDLSVTYLAQWHLIATAPSGAVRILYVRPACRATHQPPEGQYYIGLSDGRAVTYDECRPDDPQWQTVEAPNWGTGGLVPCELGHKPEYAVAESRLQGVIQDCQDMEGGFEGWTDRARYVLYTDGRLVAWPMSIGFDGLVGYGLIGIVLGAILAAILLVRRKSIWQFIRSVLTRRSSL